MYPLCIGKAFFHGTTRGEFASGDSGAKQKSVETVIGSYSSRTIFSASGTNKFFSSRYSMEDGESFGEEREGGESWNNF